MKLPLSALLVVPLAIVLLGVLRSAAQPAESVQLGDPVAATPHEGTLIVTVEIDHRGVRSLQGVRKPALRFRTPRHEAELPFRWTLRDAAGEVLASSGFDPFTVCLDPAHAGQPPHVDHGVLVPHVAHATVKLPDLAATATIAFAVVEDAQARSFGTVRRDSFPVVH